MPSEKKRKRDIESDLPTAYRSRLVYHALTRYLSDINRTKIEEHTRGVPERPVTMTLLSLAEEAGDPDTHMNVILSMQLALQDRRLRQIIIKAQLQEPTLAAAESASAADTGRTEKLQTPPADSPFIFVDYFPRYYFIPVIYPPVHGQKTKKKDSGAEGTADLELPIPFVGGKLNAHFGAHRSVTTEGGEIEGVSCVASIGNESSFVKWDVRACPGSGKKGAIQNHDFVLKICGSLSDRLVLQVFLVSPTHLSCLRCQLRSAQNVFIDHYLEA
ncbi:hypothetical protein T439DRAFT_330144 [Meredithblackwellia eburnea MCA 4105]